ncbi:MAG: hypothetical protein DSM106950_37035 [Stigonema ocellatum SAG 48.90 = DSM 106950]|nr:hypothetical protein [Stigonema ocellatum SAG 48.90 = DSM 106950]
MRFSNFRTAAAIIGLAILASTGAVPALASGGLDPSASFPDNPSTPEGVVLLDNSQQSPNTEVTDLGNTPNNDLGSEGVGQQSPNTETTNLGSTPQ